MKDKYEDLSIVQLVQLLKDDGFSFGWGKAVIDRGQNASDQEIQLLASFLKSDDKNLRRNVAAVMAMIPSPYVVRLLVENALEDQDEEVVKIVITALMQMRESAVDLLHEVMEGSTGLVHVRAALILAEIGNSDGVDILLEAIERTSLLRDEEILPRILEALGNLREPRGVVPLVKFLVGDNWLLRLVAAKSLVQLGEPSVDALLDVIRDSHDWDARCRAIDALGQIGSAKAVEPLVELLRENKGAIQNEIIDALGRIGDPTSVEALTEALGTGDPSVHFRASKALVNLGSPAVEQLSRLLEEHPKPDVRRSATVALGQIGDPVAVPVIIHALEDENSLVRKAATDALGHLKDSRAVIPLCQALRGENWFVVRGAADALAQIGDPEAIAPLLQALEDERSEVRQRIAKSLEGFCSVLKNLNSEFSDDNTSNSHSTWVELGGHQLFDTLVKALEDDDPLVRDSIARVLICLKGDNLVKKLEAIVEKGHPGAEEIRQVLAQRHKSL